jgi:hypothetical protein
VPGWLIGVVVGGAAIVGSAGGAAAVGLEGDDGVAGAEVAQDEVVVRECGIVGGWAPGVVKGGLE